MIESEHIVIAPEGKLAMGGEWSDVDQKALDRPFAETLRGLSIDQVVELLNRRPLGRLSRLAQETGRYNAVFLARPPHGERPSATHLVAYLEMLKPERRRPGDPILEAISLSATRQFAPGSFRTIQCRWQPIVVGTFNLAYVGASPAHEHPNIEKVTFESAFETLPHTQSDEGHEVDPTHSHIVLSDGGVLRVPTQLQLPGQVGVDNWT